MRDSSCPASTWHGPMGLSRCHCVPRSHLLLHTARTQGYTKVMTGESCTRVAIKLLTNLAMGRGAFLAVDTVSAIPAWEWDGTQALLRGLGLSPRRWQYLSRLLLICRALWTADTVM